MPDMVTFPGTPRWVKVFGAILIGLVLLIVLVRLTGIGGRHGPGRHIPFGEHAGQTAPTDVIEEHILPGRGH